MGNGRKLLSRSFGILFSIAIMSPVQGAEGLSTAFADVSVAKVPLGVPYAIRGPGQRSLVLKNLGDQPVRVRVEALAPSPAELRGGAQAIPDVSWLEFRPFLVDIPPRGERESEIFVTIPAQKLYRRHHYQVMIWSHTIPVGENGMTVSAGLLSRLHLETAR